MIFPDFRSLRRTESVLLRLWKSRKITFVTVCDRTEGAWHWTQAPVYVLSSLWPVHRAYVCTLYSKYLFAVSANKIQKTSSLITLSLASRSHYTIIKCKYGRKPQSHFVLLKQLINACPPPPPPPPQTTPPKSKDRKIRGVTRTGFQTLYFGQYSI